MAFDSAAATMKLVGGDLCLDFVNSVGGRVPAGVGATGSRHRMNHNGQTSAHATRSQRGQ